MRLRYPEVGTDGAHYESVYTVLSHPTAAEALWIRTTVRKRPGHPPAGAIWLTWFHDGAVRAGKVDDLPVEAADGAIVVGPARQGLDGTRGALELPSIAARWDVGFASAAAPLEHLSPSFLYRAPIPRTKSTSPVPSLVASGSVTIDTTSIDVSGWTGMLGHNWGSEHAARWSWVRAAGLGDDGAGWLDAVLGRVRIGSRLTPWTAFGMLCLDGERHRLGGLLRRGTSLDVRGDGADIALAGAGIRVGLRALVELPSTVGWQYADPTGHRHEVVNCSVATMRLEVERGGRTAVLEPTHRGVLELGGDERALDVELQPFRD